MTQIEKGIIWMTLLFFTVALSTLFYKAYDKTWWNLFPVKYSEQDFIERNTP